MTEGTAYLFTISDELPCCKNVFEIFKKFYVTQDLAQEVFILPKDVFEHSDELETAVKNHLQQTYPEMAKLELKHSQFFFILTLNPFNNSSARKMKYPDLCYYFQNSTDGEGFKSVTTIGHSSELHDLLLSKTTCIYKKFILRSAGQDFSNFNMYYEMSVKASEILSASEETAKEKEKLLSDIQILNNKLEEKRGNIKKLVDYKRDAEVQIADLRNQLNTRSVISAPALLLSVEDKTRLTEEWEATKRDAFRKECYDDWAKTKREEIKKELRKEMHASTESANSATPSSKRSHSSTPSSSNKKQK